MTFQSTKVYDGFSTVFRQWRAEGTHCKYLHGYAVSFKVTFEGDLDDKNWVYDFGGLKRSEHRIEGRNAKEWLDYMFDHTTVVAEDDPELEGFKNLEKAGVIRLRILPAVGAERFAEFLFNKLNDFIQLETQGRVRVASVEFRENERNSAIYKGEL